MIPVAHIALRSAFPKTLRGKAAVMLLRVKYWEIIADNLSKAGWELGLRVGLWIAKGERSGLLTHTATESGLLRADEKLTAFLELEAAIRFAMRCGLASPSIRARELAGLQEQMQREAPQWDSANGSKP
jgi:hypothetical protein